MTTETTMQELFDSIHPMITSTTLNLMWPAIKVQQLTEAYQRNEIGNDDYVNQLTEARKTANREAKEHEQELLVVLNTAVDGLIALVQETE
jgi:hypothetical protein